jgi:hypothetical protein
MAFKPLVNQRYYLIAKHSNKAIGFKDGSPGSSLIQMTLDPGNENQKFTFDQGNNFYWIMPTYKQRYIAVNDHSAADHTPIIQWHFEPGKQNHHFHLDPAGDGYYRIRALHSSKYFDVINASKDDNTKVLQMPLTGTDNQLFKVVPVIEDSLSPNTMSLAETNDRGREMVLQIVGLVPKVGDALSGIVAFFWTPEDKLALLWDQMKTYVDKRINDMIELKQLEAMRDDIAGLLLNVREYDDLTMGTSDKMKALTEAIKSAQQRQATFFNKKPNVLPYLIGFGTVLLSLKYKLATAYEEIAGSAPTANDKSQYLKHLQTALKDYTNEVEKHRKTLMTNRLSQIRSANHFYTPTHTTEDSFDGWQMSWSEMYEQNKPGDKNYKELAANAFTQRKKQVEEQFAADLEEATAQARLWHNFDTTATPYEAKTIKRSVGAFGGLQHTTPFATPDGATIKSITIYHEDGSFRGLEIAYKKHPETKAGKTSGSKIDLVLKDEEYISGVFGSMRNHIESLWFNTQKGNRIGAGTKAGEPVNISEQVSPLHPFGVVSTHFHGELADSLNAKLVGVSGAHNGKLVEQIIFHWEYVY